MLPSSCRQSAQAYRRVIFKRRAVPEAAFISERSERVKTGEGRLLRDAYTPLSQFGESQAAVSPGVFMASSGVCSRKKIVAAAGNA